MTEQEALRRVSLISAQLRDLANANNGNAGALDAILEADAALFTLLRQTGTAGPCALRIHTYANERLTT